MSCSARLPVYTLLIATFVPALPLWPGLNLQFAMRGLAGHVFNEPLELLPLGLVFKRCPNPLLPPPFEIEEL